MADMTSTGKKLEEAHFFLTFLRNANVSQKEFSFYLSAFVSSARSVLWIMRHEFSHVEGWTEWYDSEVLSEDEDLLFKFFNTLRINTIKMRSLETTNIIDITIPAEFISEKQREYYLSMVGCRGQLTLYSDESDVPPRDADILLPFKSLAILRQVRGSESSIDILEMCGHYYTFLERIVRECTSRFSL